MLPVCTPLLTDLYQLNMLAAYRDHAMADIAVFELFVRKLPARRGFLIAAGLEQAISYLEAFSFSESDIEALRRLGTFTDDFLGSLQGLRFTGAVDAMAEGTVFFPDEPLIRVVAPLPEAQLVETRLINLIHFETVIASKAARQVLAAQGKPLIDFGLRRAHGAEAGMLAARASYLAGFAGTATLAACIAFGIPARGTMAHSFIQAHADEGAAFEHFARSRPRDLVLLIDTYDTERAARRVAALAHRLAGEGIAIGGVRIDSGDLGAEARKVRRILDDAGCANITIVASGGLDEDDLLALREAPIDSFGIGTSLTTASDAPALDCAYKLQEYAGIPRRKRSAGKATWPGRKQVWRRYGHGGELAGDIVALASEPCSGEPLLRPVMRGGKRIATAASLQESRSYAAAQLARLPTPLARLKPFAYPVSISRGLRDLAGRLDRADADAAV